MKLRGAGWILLLCLCFAAAESEVELDGANPLAKVIQLMTNLQGHVITDGEEAQKAYKDYTAWCGKSALQLQEEIKDGEATKEELEGKIEKASSDAEDASATISGLTGSIAMDEADLKAGTLLREKERGDSQAVEQELSSAIETLAHAYKILDTELKKAGVAKASFLQKPTKGLELFQATLAEVVNAAALLSEDDGEVMSTMLQQAGLAAHGEADGEEEGDSDTPGAPAAGVYESHSSGILEAISGMKKKAEQALAESRTKEQNQRLNYEGFAEALSSKIAVEKKDLENTKSDLAKANEVKAMATKELGPCTQGLNENKAALEQLQRECMNRATEFAEEMRTHAAELRALATAKKAIQDSSGGSKLLQFVQVSSKRHRSKEQLGRIARAADDQVHKLRSLARKLGSLALAQLASRISAAVKHGTADPFEKVRGIVQGMIAKLEKQQKAEATQKQFCDREMKHTKETQDARSDDIEEMTVHLESVTAEIARLQQDLKTLSADLSFLSKSQAEMDTVRKEENTAFLKLEADLKQGLAGIQRALEILRDYYGGGSPAAALLQEDVAAKMQQEARSKDTSPAGAGGSIIGMLETVEADFAKSLTESQSLESEAKSEYERSVQQNRVATAEMETTVKHKGEEMAKLRKDSSQVTADRAEAQQELDAVNEYWAKLMKQCSQEKETYLTRAAKRDTEIRALQEAMAALEAA